MAPSLKKIAFQRTNSWSVPALTVTQWSTSFIEESTEGEASWWDGRDVKLSEQSKHISCSTETPLRQTKDSITSWRLQYSPPETALQHRGELFCVQQPTCFPGRQRGGKKTKNDRLRDFHKERFDLFRSVFQVLVMGFGVIVRGKKKRLRQFPPMLPFQHWRSAVFNLQ